MHVEITRDQGRNWIDLNVPLWQRIFGGGEWWYWWSVTCKLTFSEEEKFKLSYFDDSFTLFSDTAVWHWMPPEFDGPVKFSVKQCAEKGGFERKYSTKSEADRFANRLKNEILPRLKALSEQGAPSSTTGESFEL